MRYLGIFVAVFLLMALAVSCMDEKTIEFKRYYSSGAVVYQQRCQNCHGTKGEGLSALIPPLTDSVYLKANERQLACFIKNGLKGSISVNGKLFEGEMPASGLSPIEIAQVLTYVRNSFGNKADVINVDMSTGDLQNCR